MTSEPNFVAPYLTVYAEKAVEPTPDELQEIYEKCLRDMQNEHDETMVELRGRYEVVSRSKDLFDGTKTQHLTITAMQRIGSTDRLHYRHARTRR